MNFQPSRAESLQVTNNSLELSLSMKSKGRKLFRVFFLAVRIFHASCSIFGTGIFNFAALLAVCSILELKLPFCMIFANICNVLELKYFIWHAICNILELERNILELESSMLLAISNILELESCVWHAFCKTLLVVGCCLLVVWCGHCLGVASVCDFLILVLVAVNHQQSHEVKKPSIKALQSPRRKKNWQKHQGQKKQENKKIVHVVCAICSAFCNVNLRFGDRTSHFAWHLRHLEDRPCQAAWYCRILQMIISACLTFHFNT